MLKFLFSLSLLTVLCQLANAQNTVLPEYPQNYFIRPLDLPPIIAGNFGEIRSNHFHSGLDLKTNQREGHPVYASADGNISRIRVQIGGGGNALYISHPNGYTTVYMHLRNFNDRISMTLKNYQYRMQKFDVDFPLLSVEIPVKKGEIIAWSGNTGSSSGPHLHFEIRDTKTEDPINPQLFGIRIPDQVKPVITGLYLYHLNGEPFSELTPKQAYPVSGVAGTYQLSPQTVVTIGGESGLGIACSDKNSASENSNGPYSIELRIDDQTIYSSVWERFSFENSRGINSHIDYPAMIATGRRIQKSFIEPGNSLKIYKNVINNGILNYTDQNIRNAQYIVKDIAGNQSVLNFKIRYNPASVKTSLIPEGKRFKFNQVNEFDSAGLKLNLPLNTLYDDLNFTYKNSPMPAGAYSLIHHVHNRLMPLNGALSLAIKADDSLPVELQSKALIVNRLKKSQGGTFVNGYVKTEIRNFDSFYIMTDTMAPRIVPVNISNGASMLNTSKILFRISDNLSGIKTFNAMINGKWVLMEYEPKTGTIWYTFDELTAKGKNDFELTVSDMKDNLTNYRAVFYR
ncbi:MAG: M23 family metallopeptidase [Daejeonella sp.]|uniref:M23 family metallopeptidase n=1 Tax=Daejeonella sp. TaxID=2805397 RepID=UPI002733D46B|nr:M23 family metallopeptidase [Daejeonella sp.]MDP3467474.1 M23 family metallopeptidase [Daejeonella sp.]